MGLVSYVVPTPVLTFSLLRDWDRITRTCGELLPRSEHGRRIGDPIAAGLKLLVVRGLARYKTSDLYRGGGVTTRT